MEEQKQRQSTITGKKIIDKYDGKVSLLQIREAIRDGILHPTTLLGERIYDINKLLCQFEEGSTRAGSQVLCDLLEEPRWRRAIAEIAIGRGQQTELPSEHPEGWYGIDYCTPPERFHDDPAVLYGILEEISGFLFLEAEVQAWIAGDQPTLEPTGEVQERSESIRQPDYVFQQTGPTWKIVYRGKESSGLKGKGFLYLHFLTQHPRKEFTALELQNLKQEGSFGDLSGFKVRSKSGDDGEDDNESLSISQDYQEIWDEETISGITNEIVRLKRVEGEATTKGLHAEALSHKKKREALEGFFTEAITDEKTSRAFKSVRDKALNTISKNIRLALLNLKNHDELAARHFESAILPLKSHSIRYSPTEEHPWDFHQ